MIGTDGHGVDCNPGQPKKHMKKVPVIPIKFPRLVSASVAEIAVSIEK